MRRINPLSLRLGLTANWQNTSKITNSIHLEHLFNHFDYNLRHKVNNLQTSRLRFKSRRFYFRKKYLRRRIEKYFFEQRSALFLRRQRKNIKNNYFFFKIYVRRFMRRFKRRLRSFHSKSIFLKKRKKSIKKKATLKIQKKSILKTSTKRRVNKSIKPGNKNRTWSNKKNVNKRNKKKHKGRFKEKIKKKIKFQPFRSNLLVTPKVSRIPLNNFFAANLTKSDAGLHFSFPSFNYSRRLFSTFKGQKKKVKFSKNNFKKSTSFFKKPQSNNKKLKYNFKKYKGVWWKNKKFFLKSRHRWVPLKYIPKWEKQWWMYKLRSKTNTSVLRLYRRKMKFFSSPAVFRYAFKRLFLPSVFSKFPYAQKSIWLRNKKGIIPRNFFLSLSKQKSKITFLKKYVNVLKNEKKKTALKLLLLKRLKNFSVLIRRRKAYRRNAVRLNFSSLVSRRRWVNVPLFFVSKTKRNPCWPFLSRKKKYKRIRERLKKQKYTLPMKPWLYPRYRLGVTSKFFNPTIRRFKFLNSFEKFSETTSTDFFFRVVPRNAQLSILSNLSFARLVYQAPVYARLGRFKRRLRKTQSWHYLAMLLTTAFQWRNAVLVTSVLGLEFRKTRYHYRFFKIFGKFLRLFLASQVFFLNFVIRVRGCFGKIARTRSLFLQPLSKFHIGLKFSNYYYPVHFSFKHILTRRGVFSFAVWCV